jgi:hypothetical protein
MDSRGERMSACTVCGGTEWVPSPGEFEEVPCWECYCANPLSGIEALFQECEEKGWNPMVGKLTTGNWVASTGEAYSRHFAPTAVAALQAAMNEREVTE